MELVLCRAAHRDAGRQRKSRPAQSLPRPNLVNGGGCSLSCWRSLESLFCCGWPYDLLPAADIRPVFVSGLKRVGSVQMEVTVRTVRTRENQENP